MIAGVFALLLIAALAPSLGGFVIDSRVDLPYPKLAGSVDVDSSLSPQLVRALYEVTFHVEPTGSNRQQQVQLVSLGGKPCQGEKCTYFVPANDPLVVRVEDMVDNLVTKKTEDEVPVIAGFDPEKIREVVDAFNKSVREQTDNRVKLTSKTSTTTEASDDTTIPVYKGTIDTEAVLNQPEPSSTVRPQHKPYYPPYKPNYQYYPNQRPYHYPENYGPYHRPWERNPCLVPPCYYNNYRPKNQYGYRS